MAMGLTPENNKAGDEHIEQGKRNHCFPAKIHQLVVTETRNGPAYPHKEENEAGDLAKHTQHLDQSEQVGTMVHTESDIVQERHVVPAKEQRYHHGAADEHVHVFGEKIEPELHRGILLVITHVQFAFCFGQIEGRTVTLGKSADQEDEESKRLFKDVPDMILLLADNVAQAERTGQHQQCDEAYAHRQLVRYDLRSPADGGQQ